ncbi:MAG: PAS domain S-box protein [Anaerolineae bacterium]
MTNPRFLEDDQENQDTPKTPLTDELGLMRQNMAQLRQLATEIEASASRRPQSEERPQSSERSFHQFVLSISDHIYVTEITRDGQHINRYLSPNVETLTGHLRARLMANWAFWPTHIVHPDDRAAGAAQAKRLAQGQSSEIEYRLVRADGRIIWVRDSARVEDQGDSKMVYGVVSDITERKRREAALAKLLELSRALVTTHDPSQLLNQAIRAATEIVQTADRGSLQLLDDTGQILRTVAISSPGERLGQTLIFKPGVGIAGHALASNRTINVPDVLADSRFVPSDLPLRFRSLLVAPLVVKSRLLGTISLSSKQIKAFSAADEALVQVIADQVAAALENARLFNSHLQAEKLRKSYEFLQATIDALGAHIAILNEKGEIIAVNARWRRYAAANGYTDPNCGLGVNYLTICDTATGLYAEEAPIVAEGIRQVISRRRTQLYLEYPIYTSLEQQWYGVRVTRFQNEGATWLVVAHEDVTERRKAEEGLRASEEQYRSLTNQLPVGVYRDTNKGRLAYANQAMAAILGYDSIDEVMQISLRDAFDDPGERDKQLEPWRTSGGFIFNEMKLRTKKGEQVWVRDIARIELNEAGEIGYIDGIIQDITNYKEAELAVQASEIRFRSLVQNSSDIITVVAADGTVQYVSPTIERILGYKPETIRGGQAAQYLHPDDVETIRRQFSQILEHPGVASAPFEFRIRHAEGEWVWMEVVANNLLNDPVIQGIVINARDISKRRQMEEQLHQLEMQFLHVQKMEAIGRLAGGVAHDFNNLLTVINGYSELVLSQLDKSNPLYSYIELIKKTGVQTAQLTRQLLIFSRQEMVQPEVINLNSVVTDMEAMVKRLVGEDIQVTTQLEPNLGLIEANPGQIEQVVMNLVVNGRDAMPQGGHLTITTTDVIITETQPPLGLPPGRYAQLSISDTGIGMDEKILSHIFEPFFTTKEQGKGTGFGLSTVFAIVTECKGKIHVVSQPGEGATFHIYLPCLSEGAIAELKTNYEGLPAEDTRGSETILIVEDEEAVRSLSKLILQEQGYQILEARHGHEAIKVCQQTKRPINLLITDIVMPGGMSGQELAEHLKPLLPDAKVLYMSGYTSEVITHYGVVETSTNFLQKPFSPKALIHKVRQLLDET